MLALDERAVEWRLVEGEVIALDVTRREYLTLNDSGTVLWSLLAEGTTEQRLVDALAARYAIDTPTATSAVTDFLAELEGRGLLAPPAERSGRHAGEDDR